MMRLQTFFMAQTWIHIPTLREMCRETLNSHSGTVTSNTNLKIVFVSSFFFFFFFFFFFMTFISLPGCFGEPLGDIMH